MKNTKKIKFNLQKKYITVDNVERRLSMDYYRGLIKKCSESHRKIFNILNKFTNNSFLPLDNKDDPIHIKNPNKNWDTDDSPCRLLLIWENSIFFKHHLKIINNKINLLSTNEEQYIKINIKHRKELFIINAKISGLILKKMKNYYI